MERVVGLALAFFLISLLLGSHNRRALRVAPGPPRLPILGNIRQISDDYQHEMFTEWARKCGDVVYARFLTKAVLIINSADATRVLIEKCRAKYSGRPPCMYIRDPMTTAAGAIADSSRIGCGHVVTSVGDAHIRKVDNGLGGVLEADDPGLMFVDFFPMHEPSGSGAIVKHIPTRMSDNSWKWTAIRLRPAINSMNLDPFRAVMEVMVRDHLFISYR
ncbi:uncharacterized protein B0H18DRAFT_958519 [Fomitopsis serialis]|uniref:uncharacterized protein n=1 Tax=Fomitopsis serialis TaxID=139415 RepID=UPI0020085CB4|nr:uncharacterized protein B0H18DRAFT_958519 [Neoantrodia serialis]KAH9917074.1 hypothetical protein B0H18DRAFT_958519 [Neoantrodia serialis]